MSSDPFARLSRHPLGGRVFKALGLPRPVALARAEGGYEARPLAGRAVLVGAAPGGFATARLVAALREAGAEPLSEVPEAAPLEAVVFDATGCATPQDARALYSFFHPVMRRLAVNARVLVVGPIPEAASGAVAAAAARGIEGFVRSLGKEIGARGGTANLVYVEPQAVDRLDAAVRFFCGARTTYVSGQALRVTARVAPPEALPTSAVLAGKVALVTGAARGIGAATAQRLAEEGAHVICLDVPQVQDALVVTAAAIGGQPLALDLTAPEAPARLAEVLRDQHGGLDVLVHNAGITRDRTLAKMSDAEWDAVVAVNFAAIAAVDERLLGDGLLRQGARLVCLSSISGVAGNFGQANYATTKSALIGYVAARSRELEAQGININAVAPGFIETPMTGQMPVMMREAGRRLNSLSQGGTPRDVAEAIAFLVQPGAYGFTGQTLRVCGQALIGA